MSARFTWTADRTGYSHATDVGFRTCCGLPALDPKWGWPERQRCPRCLQAVHLMTGTPLADLAAPAPPASPTDGVAGPTAPETGRSRPSARRRRQRAVRSTSEHEGR